MAYAHSIFLTAEAEGRDPLPELIAANIESLRRQHPGFAHTLYGNDSGRAFIASHFGREVVDAWDALVPLSYKSDLLRFCLLHQRGGVYADVSLHAFAPLETDPAGAKLRIFRDVINNAPWIASTSLIYAPPHHPVFAFCIDKIVEHMRTGYYGHDPLCPTGPNLLGAQIARWGQTGEMITGETGSILRSAGGQLAGRTFLSPAGDLIAVIAKSGAGLASLGARTQDDYNEFYHNRKIYRSAMTPSEPARAPSPLTARPTWTAEDFRQNAWLNAAAEIDAGRGLYRLAQGCALYGPYARLDKGGYRARFIFAHDRAAGSPLPVRIDVYGQSGQVMPARGAVAVPHADGIAYDCAFDLPQDDGGVEVRLFLDAEREMRFLRLELHHIAAAA